MIHQVWLTVRLCGDRLRNQSDLPLELKVEVLQQHRQDGAHLQCRQSFSRALPNWINELAVRRTQSERKTHFHIRKACKQRRSSAHSEWNDLGRTSWGLTTHLESLTSRAFPWRGTSVRDQTIESSYSKFTRQWRAMLYSRSHHHWHCQSNE